MVNWLTKKLEIFFLGGSEQKVLLPILLYSIQAMIGFVVFRGDSSRLRWRDKVAQGDFPWR